MNRLQEEIDAINFADADELSITVGAGFRTFLKILIPILPLALICAAIPSAIIAALPIDEFATNFYAHMTHITEEMRQLKAATMAMRIEQLIVSPFSMLVYITATVSAVRALAKNQQGCLADFKTAMGRLLPLIGTDMLLFVIFIGIILAFVLVMVIAGTALGSFLGPQAKEVSALLSIPIAVGVAVVAIWIAIRLVFFSHSVVVGASAGTASFKESVALVKGRWWATLGTLIVIGLIGALLSIPSFVAGIREGGISSVSASYFARAFAGTITTTLGFAGALFGISAMTVLYLMRRKSTSGLGCVGYGAQEDEYGSGRGYAE